MRNLVFQNYPNLSDSLNLTRKLFAVALAQASTNTRWPSLSTRVLKCEREPPGGGSNCYLEEVHWESAGVWHIWYSGIDLSDLCNTVVLLH